MTSFFRTPALTYLSAVTVFVITLIAVFTLRADGGVWHLALRNHVDVEVYAGGALAFQHNTGLYSQSYPTADNPWISPTPRSQHYYSNP